MDATLKDCKKCPHMVRASVFMAVCNCACGRATRNSAHPLAPCNYVNGNCALLEDWQTFPPCDNPEYDIYGDSYTEGGRCWLYLKWLDRMDKHNGPWFKYPGQDEKGARL